MRTPPPDVRANWPSPNFVNPALKGQSLLITQVILVPLALTALVARLFVRIRIVKRWGCDDVLMIFAWIFSLGVTITVILATERYGWRMHVWDLTFAKIVAGRKASIAAQTLFLFATTCVKTSILSSYLRLALPGSWFRWFTLAGLAFVVVTFATFFVVLWAQCIPAYYYWSDIDSEACIEEGPPLVVQTATGVLTDFIIYLIPLPTLSILRLPTPQRIALFLIFSLGLLVVFACCMRLYWVIQVTLYTYDVTWDGFELWIWTAVEVNMGVVCGCAPMLRPLVMRWFAFMRSGRKGLSEVRMV